MKLIENNYFFITVKKLLIVKTRGSPDIYIKYENILKYGYFYYRNK